MARKLKDLTILELLDEWWNELKKLYRYSGKLSINVSTRERERLEAIDEELVKKMGSSESTPFHRDRNLKFDRFNLVVEEGQNVGKRL